MKKSDFKFKALWTICVITLVYEEKTWINKIINNYHKQILDFEKEFSRFREDSTLSKINKLKKLEVSDDFLILINKSREIYKLTNWYFNPLIDVRKIWYTHNFEEKNFEKLEIDEDLSFEEVKNYWNLLEIGKYMNLDFWSIAKWYLAEKISNDLVKIWYKNNLVNIWGDIYVNWKNLENKPWQIAINNPQDENNSIIIEISNSSISTSWTYLRNWEISWERFHHIRNPFSRKQENELISVSIIHERWYFTDAIATAIIAMWKNKALDFCKENKIKYIFILNNWEVLKNI